MTTIRWGATLGLLAAALVQAGSGTHSPGGGKHNPTYFGRWGGGAPNAYGQKAPTYDNPWTAKVFGCRVCRTPEEQYAAFNRQYQIEQARHMVALDRLNWNHYENQMNPRPNGLGGFLGRCGCGPVGERCPRCGNGCNSCGTGGCSTCGKGGLFAGHGKGGCAGGNCGVGGHQSLNEKLFGGSRANRGMGEFPVVPPGAPYPAMNPEDAMRYVEGFQYYPPNQLIRSPRDFFMMDVRYGLGR
jgi:hypothetical protein